MNWLNRHSTREHSGDAAPMGIEYRLFYRPASADELKKRKIKGYTVTADGEYLCHAGLKTVAVVDSSEEFVPHSKAVALRYVGTGQVDIRVVVETGDPGMEKTDKRAEPLIVDSEEAANTSLQEAKLGEITFPGARVKVRD